MTSAEAVSTDGQAGALAADHAASLPAPPIPRYGESTLADLATSVLAALGIPGEANPLGLPAADRICLLVVDGLGWDLLREHPAAAPFLSELARSGRPLTAGFPATTVTSLSSLGTGLPPGQHGMLGYQVAVPGTGRLLNALRWDKRVDPLSWQPSSTIFERAGAAGVAAYRIAQGSYRDSGLSTAVMRGAIYRSADTLGRAGRAGRGGTGRPSPGRSRWCMSRRLDSTGHVCGCGSDAWRFQLGHVDRLAEQLAGALPHGTALYVTADHGMVDVGPADRIDVDAQPGMRAGVACSAGSRAPGTSTPGPVPPPTCSPPGARRCRRAAWVASREEAIADGWFGPVESRHGRRGSATWSRPAPDRGPSSRPGPSRASPR